MKYVLTNEKLFIAEQIIKEVILCSVFIGVNKKRKRCTPFPFIPDED
jgi:hypothetical protein